MKTVVILQTRLLHYRVELFTRLRQACRDRGMDLQLVHGAATRRERVKQDEGFLDWALKVQNRVFEAGGRDLLWQPLPASARSADLLVLMQESRILSNYPLLLSQCWRPRKIAFWGHGRNFQSHAPDGWRERWKSWMVSRVHWWFAYTDLTRDIVRSAGFPEERITVLDNAIDNDGFRADLASWSEGEVQQQRGVLGIGPDDPVAVFCGSLYPEKRLDLLMAAGDRIRQALPGFKLIVIGDGPSMPELRNRACARDWLVVTGIQTGRDKARLFRMADVMLNPGLVGLHVLDAFCAGLVMITTDTALHSPEIAYLHDGVNGLIVGGDADEYARAVVRLFGDRERLDELKRGASADSQRYTLDGMVSHFVDGLERALVTP